MTSNMMNFGPAWMRLPAKTNQPQNDLIPRATSPLQEWSQPAAVSHQPQTPTATSFSYSSVAANNLRSQGMAASAFDPSHVDGSPSDTLNPFKYSKELMLSLFKPVGFPLEFERHDYVTSEDALIPMSSQPFSDQEIKILSGSVNSEVARRVAQPGDQPTDRPQTQRRESLSNNDSSKDRDHLGRHDRSDKNLHSRNHDLKYQGSGVRTRNLNKDDQGHSFKRSEQTPRDQEDGLWNSPVRNTVGSFDANGVFRVTHEEGEALAAAEEIEGAPEATASNSNDVLQGIEESPQESQTRSSPGSQQSAPSAQDQALSENGSDKGDPSLLKGVKGNHHEEESRFSNSLAPANPAEADTTREGAEFAPFSVSSGSTFSPAPSFDPLPVELSKWLYRDPSGSIQGPFQSAEMHEWYKGGFFSMDLLVKREQDPTFEPLGSLIRRIGSEDKPFLLAGIIRQEAPVVRPSISLPQTRQGLGHFSHSSWGGLSAPSTPGTPGFGVDRMFMQQQQQQQQPQQHQSSSDLFAGAPQQQRPDYGPSQDSTNSFSGFEQKWNSGLFGSSQAMDPHAGWAGDAFSRSPIANIATPQTPLAGGYMSQQQRLLNQQLERQQYLQLLQRQSQMQHILHQQQFMAAQQQYGNDHHALAALLNQQQAQQRQLQMRQQQLQHVGFHGQGVSTPGGTAMPWGGLGQQPSSPWSTSIIQPSTDNYFDYQNGEQQTGPHSMQQQQQHQQPQQQAQHHQHHQHHQHQQEHPSGQSVRPSNAVDEHSSQAQFREQRQPEIQKEEEQVATLADRVNDLTVDQKEHKVEAPVPQAENLDPLPHTAEFSPEDEMVQEEEARVIVPKFEHHHDEPQEEEEEEVAIEEEQVARDDLAAAHDPTHDESAAAEAEEIEDVEDAASDAASTHTIEPRPIKASPAPWAKSASEEDVTEKKGPTLREIQEMEAKKAEEIRAAERQAQMAAAASGVLDFGKGLGGSPWQTSSAPKKKTLREIQQEEEAALQRARASQPAAPAPVSGGAVGLAAIVASSGTGSIGKRYADTIGPKPVTVTANSGPWGSASAGPKVTTPAAPRLVQTPSYNAIAGSPTPSRALDNSWTEVESKKGGSQKSSADNFPSISSASVSRPAVVHSSNITHARNSNEARGPSDDFMKWCRQALKGLQGVVLEDFIQMLLSFPLNPDPMTVEIIQDSIYANSQSLDGRRFADEFVRRRKADAYPNGAQPLSSTNSGASLSSSSHDSSFKIVAKKGKKKGTA